MLLSISLVLGLLVTLFGPPDGVLTLHGMITLCICFIVGFASLITDKPYLLFFISKKLIYYLICSRINAEELKVLLQTTNISFSIFKNPRTHSWYFYWTSAYWSFFLQPWNSSQQKIHLLQEYTSLLQIPDVLDRLLILSTIYIYILVT